MFHRIESISGSARLELPTGLEVIRFQWIADYYSRASSHRLQVELAVETTLVKLCADTPRTKPASPILRDTVKIPAKLLADVINKAPFAISLEVRRVLSVTVITD